MKDNDPKPTGNAPKAQDKNKKTDRPEKNKPAAQKSIMLNSDQYQTLEQLGGKIEEHVASAIELDLESLRPEYRGLRETEQDKRGEAAVYLTNEEDCDDTEEDETEDDDLWFDPDRYDEESKSEVTLFR